MATIIDSLLVQIGINASGFTQGAAQAGQDLDKIKEKVKELEREIRAEVAEEKRAASEITEAKREKAAEEKAIADAAQKERERIAREQRDNSEKARKDSEETAKKIGGHLESLRNTVLGFFAALIGATAVGSFFNSIVSNDAAIGRMATNVGLSTETLAAWQFAAEQAGGTAQGVTASIMGLEQAYEQFRLTGQVSGPLAWTRALGVDARDAVGAFEQLNEKFYDLAQSGQGARALAMGQNLGLDIGTIQLLETDPAAVQKMLAQGRATAPSAEDAARAIAFQQAWNAASKAVIQFGRDLAEVALPPLTELLVKMDQWIRDSRKWLTADIIDGVKQVWAWLQGIDWNGVITGAKAFFASLNDVVTGLAGLLKLLGLIPTSTRREDDELRQRGLARPGTEVPYTPEEQRRRDDPAGTFWREHVAPLFGLPKPVQLGTLDPSIEAAVRNAAQAAGLDEDHMVALARAEGGGYRGVSPTGAIGPMQLEPGTAAEVGVNPWDWHENVRGGVEYYRRLLAQFHGNYAAADAAYNAGPNNAGVQRFAATGDPSGLPAETRGYLSNIRGAEPAPAVTGADGQPLKIAPQASPGPAVPISYQVPSWLRSTFSPALSPSPLATAGLTTGAQASVASRVTNNNQSTSVDSDVNINTLHINTAATDANGVARGIGDALKNYMMASQANFALV
jgi:hypothetical protein